MPTQSLTFFESDIVKLVLEFLQRRDLCISMLSLERETGQINGLFSEDMLFLRQLVLEGQWDDALDFVQPLEGTPGYPVRPVRYLLLKHKYLELLCIRAEAGNGPASLEAVASGDADEVVKCLNSLEGECPTKEEYNQLCLLLTVARLEEHPEYQNWNPSCGRVRCFGELHKILEPYLRLDSRLRTENQVAKDDRLVQLLIKGLLYESCVEFCQAKATYQDPELRIPNPLENTGFTAADYSLLSWLQSVPSKTFDCPFEERTPKIDVHPLNRPSLEASWAEQILVQPIKPKMFPYSHMPGVRGRADILSRSLIPSFDGLSYGLGRNRNLQGDQVGQMTRSMAGFHLSSGHAFPRPQTAGPSLPSVSASAGSGGDNGMQKSVDRLFSDAHHSEPVTRLSAGNALAKATILEEQSTEASLSPKTSEHELAGRPGVSQGANSREEDLALFREYERRQRVQEDLDRRERERQDLQAQLDDWDGRNRSGRSSAGLEVQAPASSSEQRSIYHTPPDSSPPTGQRGLRGRISASGSREGLSGSTGALRNSQHLAQQVPMDASAVGNPRFLPVTALEDPQAIRTVAFHPQGHLYTIGSNSKTLRVCRFPDINEISDSHVPSQPTVVWKKNKHHKGSIYCVAWSPDGELIATGSNDKSVRVLRVDPDTGEAPTWNESEFLHHDGTVRDCVFMQDSGGGPTLLVSAGAGDCKVYVTDCNTGATVRAMPGHAGHVYALHTWAGRMFVSGSADQTARLWDLRAAAPVQIVPSYAGAGPGGSAFAAVCVDPTGRLLGSGHEDATVALYDIRGARHLNAYRPHTSDVRTVRFSNNSYYLLSGSYDRKVILTDLHGDLVQSLPHVTVAEHRDKVIQCRWHPEQLAFVSTSADRTATCWVLPPL